MVAGYDDDLSPSSVRSDGCELGQLALELQNVGRVWSRPVEYVTGVDDQWRVFGHDVLDDRVQAAHHVQTTGVTTVGEVRVCLVAQMGVGQMGEGEI